MVLRQGFAFAAQGHAEARGFADALMLTWISTRIEPRPRRFLCVGDPLAAHPATRNQAMVASDWQACLIHSVAWAPNVQLRAIVSGDARFRSPGGRSSNRWGWPMPRRTVVAHPDFGRKLKELREQHGLSLRRLGGVIHCSHGYLWDLESGIKRPSLSVAVLLDHALEAGGQLSAMVSEVSADTVARPVAVEQAVVAIPSAARTVPLVLAAALGRWAVVVGGRVVRRGGSGAGCSRSSR